MEFTWDELLSDWLLFASLGWFLLDPPDDLAHRSSSHLEDVMDEEKAGGDDTCITTGPTQRQSLPVCWTRKRRGFI